MQDYDLEPDPSDRLLLDVLVRLEAVDDPLTLRRSCREGACGSDAMDINGRNGLACVTPISGLNDPFRLFGCRTIMSCTEVCPRGLSPSRAIEKIRLTMNQGRDVIAESAELCHDQNTP